MVLLVRKLKLHLGPILLAVFLLIAAAAWQAAYSVQNGRNASGGSLPGLVIGSTAAAIIFFELLLWPRKALRRFRLFQTKTWMAFHIWLGLASGPLAWIHAGYRFGGTFSTVLMVLLLFVLASGLYGWIMQIVIPRWMLGNLPQETILSQIDDVTIQNALEARQMLTVALGPKPEVAAKLAPLDEIAETMRGSSTQFDGQGRVASIVVGARQRRLPHRSAMRDTAQGEVTDHDRNEIWRSYAAVIEPYLLSNNDRIASVDRVNGTRSESPLRTLQRSLDWFSLLRESCSPATAPLLDKLHAFSDQRHQFDSQRRAHAWLHGWIAVHAGVSILLGVLLVTHIVLALRFW